MKRKFTIVTGGAGFLGSHVVRLLIEEGHDVLALDDMSNGKEMHLEALRGHPQFRLEPCDITEGDLVARWCRGAEYIVHLAVLDLRQSIKEPLRVNDVVVRGTLNCLEAARKHGVRLFINCSSSEVFGTAIRTPMDEEHPLRPETPYAAAKAAQDMYVHAYGRTYGLPWTTLRPFNMYGPNSHWQGFRGELIPKMIVRAMNGQPLVVFGDGRQTRDFIYVEDAARAFVLATRTAACQGTSINVCSGQETAIGAIAEKICRAFGIDPATGIERQPARPGDVRRHWGDATRCREVLGYTPPTAFDQGLAHTLDWFKTLPMEPAALLAQEVARNWE